MATLSCSDKRWVDHGSLSKWKCADKPWPLANFQHPPIPPDWANANLWQLLLQRRPQPPGPGHSNGNQSGAILRQPVDGKPGEQSDGHEQYQTKSLSRICSKREDFVKRSSKLRDHLLARCYETNSVDHQIQRAALIPRTSPTTLHTVTTTMPSALGNHIPPWTDQLDEHCQQHLPIRATCLQEPETSHHQPTTGDV